MTLNFVDLDEDTRAQALTEIAMGDCYKSPRLYPAGQNAWQALIADAMAARDEDWLAQKILHQGFMKSEEIFLRNGVSHKRKINQLQAAQQLAEGEFNRYYLRGLCQRALRDHIDYLIVYRAKPVTDPRPDSGSKIGNRVPALELLNALRSNNFVSIAFDLLAIPSGPNSGLSARLPRPGE